MARVGTAGAVVTEALAAYGIVPRLVHSTSRRHEGQQVVLTYVAIPPDGQAPSGPSAPLVSRQLGRVELARWDATRRRRGSTSSKWWSTRSGTRAGWRRMTRSSRGELRDWAGVLDAYGPEPFRSLWALR